MVGKKLFVLPLLFLLSLPGWSWPKKSPPHPPPVSTADIERTQSKLRDVVKDMRDFIELYDLFLPSEVEEIKDFQCRLEAVDPASSDAAEKIKQIKADLLVFEFAHQYRFKLIWL